MYGIWGSLMDSGTRRDYYVYFHRDKAGSIFYVGKGTKRRANSLDRHPAWKKYVAEHLLGEYTVEIHADGLTEDQAEELESALISEYGEQLINWFNAGRTFDYKALEKFHALRDKNRDFVAATKQYETSDLELAARRYSQALSAMREYEALTLERGLVAEMDVGPNWGDLNILDRLTICLSKLGRFVEAAAVSDEYFRDFPTALKLAAGKRILARIEKIKCKLGKSAEASSHNSLDPTNPVRGGSRSSGK